jgi:hypothetical protein
VVVLMALRAMPAFLTAPVATWRKARETRARTSGRLRTMLGGDFALLEEQPPHELVLGLTGRFWTPSGGLVPSHPDTFRDDVPAGLARAAWNSPDANRAGPPLGTETRVRFGDADTARRFTRMAAHQSGQRAIRWAILRQVWRTAERAAARRRPWCLLRGCPVFRAATLETMSTRAFALATLGLSLRLPSRTPTSRRERTSQLEGPSARWSTCSAVAACRLTTTVSLKGQRMLSITGETGEIIDLAEEKVYTLDLKGKSYSVMTFAEMRKRMEEAMAKAEKDAAAAKPEPEPEARKGEPQKEYEVDFAIAPGPGAKAVAGTDTKEQIATITVREKGKTLEEAGGLVPRHILWMGRRCRPAELNDFRAKLRAEGLRADGGAGRAEHDAGHGDVSADEGRHGEVRRRGEEAERLAAAHRDGLHRRGAARQPE